MAIPEDNQARDPLRLSLVCCGGCFAALGLLLLAGVMLGLVPAAAFALGQEGGLRVIGTVVVLGCLMMAIGFCDE